MPLNSIGWVPVGPTIALSVTAASHAAIAVGETANTQCNYASCLNTGAVAVAIALTQNGRAATLPVDGTPGDFILPPAMQIPVVLPLPTATPQVTAIGAAAGPSLVYVTPITLG